MRKAVGALIGVITILSSCGGGDNSAPNRGNIANVPSTTPPPPTSTAGCSLTERQNWAGGELERYYLFPETLPANPSPSGYATVQEYIDYLTTQARREDKDRSFTYITSIEEETAFYNSGSRAGLGIRLAFDENNNLFVSEGLEGAPALAAGIDRGTQILGIGTSANSVRAVTDLVASGADFGDLLAPNTLFFDITDAGGRRTVSVTKTEYDLIPVSKRYGAKVLDDNGEKIGYINLRTFIDPAGPALRSAFQNYKQQGVTKVIVDLRYNGGGLVSVAELFSNLMGANRSRSDVLAYTTFRSSLSSENETTYFDPQVQSIAPTKIAFIGTGASASASELVMNSFVPYLGVNNALIGANTFGKPVGQIARDRPQCDDRLRIVAFRTENANRQGDYYKGLAQFMKTTCQAADDLDYQLGDPREASVSKALDFLAGRGTCTPIAATSTARVSGTTTQGYQQSVALKRWDPVMPDAPSTAERENPGLY